ncbi:uncharacterized protein LOC124407966 [Diprion similis]|uniref:uncharacterized protein LOC124407966 n=1 Tax=Diprion similis TaxID=362088 RepID=UPI001EF80E5E|nr:uncharacterized protein LOC124407966 [Diprion similis]
MNENTKDDSQDPINSISTEQIEHVEATVCNEIPNSDDDVESQSDEGSEYNPEDQYNEQDSSDVADSDDNPDDSEAYAPNQSANMNGSKNQSTDRSCNLSSISNVPGTSACDDTESVHKDEAEVKKFAMLPKKTAERATIIKNLRDKGNYIHNKNSDFNQGELIPCRRPQKKMNENAQHFVPCPNCRGFYAKSNVRHHYKYCAGGSRANSRSILVAARKMLGRIDPAASVKLRKKVLPMMREDEIVRLIRYDHLLTLYGNKMCRKIKKQHQYSMIRANLRLQGRFLTDLKKINPEITEFASLYDQKFYDAVISSINNVAEFDEETEVYEKPSLASGIGTCIKKIGAILETECIKQHKAEKKRNTADFLKLFNEDFGCSVGRTVTESQIKHRRQKTVNLPETDDIVRLNNFLNKKREAAYQSLQKKFTYETWLSLAQATLILIQVFNRRRAGEIERVTIDDFNCRKGADEIDKHSLSSLPIEEQKAARKYVRLTICGKLNRTVPVLLSTEIVQSVLTIIQYQGLAKVPDNNPYIFGLPGTTDPNRHVHLRACNLMRKFAEESSAVNTKALRGTTLRKHVATKCASMDLSENDICDVANFMGHHENIHKNIYRQPVINRDIIRMSQVLEQAVGTSNAKSETRDCIKEYVMDMMNSESTLHDAPDSADDLDDSLEKQNQLLACINNQKKKHIQSKNKYRNYDAKKSMNDESVKKSTDMESLSSRDSCNNYFNAINSQSSDTEDDNQAKGGNKTNRKQHSNKIQMKRRRWSHDEVEACLTLFETDITKSIIPPLPVIAKKIANYDCLKTRTTVVVKAWINNQIKKRETLESRGANKKQYLGFITSSSRYESTKCVRPLWKVAILAKYNNSITSNLEPKLGETSILLK